MTGKRGEKIKDSSNVVEKWSWLLKDVTRSADRDFIFYLQSQEDGIPRLLSRIKHDNPKCFALLVQILSRLCSDWTHDMFELNCVHLVERFVVKSEFRYQLTTYLTSNISNPTELNLDLFEQIIHISRRVFKSFPSEYSQSFRVIVKTAIEHLHVVKKSSELKTETELIEVLQMALSNCLKLKLLQISGSRGLTRAEIKNIKSPANNFRQISDTITHADVHQKKFLERNVDRTLLVRISLSFCGIVTIDNALQKNPILFPNITEGGYKNVEHYLDVQYRLFREDFVGPLREAIDQFIEQKATAGTRIRLEGVNVYTSVRIENVTISRMNGIIHQLHFNVRSLMDVDWANTKRLLFGTLVCLSADNFNHFTVAVIADSWPKALQRGQVYVKFLDANYESLAKSYVMIESPTYYEAYAPVLKGLKQIDECNLPFMKYLVNVSPKMKQPIYLQDKIIFRHETNLRCLSWSPLKESSWPTATQLRLDDSQNQALKAALTNEIAIIQGPPATGKTYVGLKVVQVLLENNCGQILVVCYTNHALDQFLEGILEFCPTGIIRVGGQSKSVLLDKFNLRSIKKFSPNDMGNMKHLEKETKEKMRQSVQRMNPFRNYLQCDFENRIVPDWLIIELEVISEEHAKQLEQAMYFADPRCNNSFDIWLEAEEYRLIYFKQDVIPSTPKKDASVENKVENETGNNRVNDALANEERATRIQIDDEEDMMFLESLDKATEDRHLTNNRYEKDDLDRFQNLSQEKRNQIRKKIRNELAKTSYMSEKEANSVKNIWNLKPKKRWELYRYWLHQSKNKAQTNLFRLQNHCEKLWNMYSEYRQECLLHCLKAARVIGMTTSGAARYRRNLQRIQPPILIVEEAAEVLEAHVISALTPGCQHLILIGDQQQLRPKPKMYELSEKYGLDVSLFERLIKNGFPYNRLRLQHRMRPEISTLLVPNIYPDLLDHSVVQQYPHVAGMKADVYFFDHKNFESKVADSTSKSNQFEAELLVGLCYYLLNQNYEPSQITILTGYLGQIALLKQFNLPEEVRCSSIDGYQGEENDIILLSLVRSNEKGTVGFLKVENRVCVALSRAKIGLYCVGNFDLLESQTEVWKPIIEKLRTANLIGPSFILVCQNHPQTVTSISEPNDFEKVSCGGCSLPCEFQLACGHMCPHTCHVMDEKHEFIQCQSLCLKPICQLGHKCHKKCGVECGKCEAPVLKLFYCGHENVVPCNIEPDSILCPTMAMCELECGHKAAVPCEQNPSDYQCQEMVEHLLNCHHKAKMKCFMDPMHFKCKTAVEKRLKCGHLARVCCSDNSYNHKCLEKCSRLLLCGHKTIALCSQDIKSILCMEKCNKLLKCGHLCQLNCCMVCDITKCISPIEVQSPCGHTVATPCNDRGNAETYCKISCSTELPCGHRCKGTCSSCCQSRIHIPCKARCSRILLNGEKCSNICSRICFKKNRGLSRYLCVHGERSTPCDKPCEWKCEHKSCTKLCGEQCNRKACDEPCSMKLSCGHKCLGFCGEPCPNVCHSCSKSSYIQKVVLGLKKNKKSRFILLEDCGHIIEKSLMDESILKNKNRLTVAVEIANKLCPKCNAPIRHNFRYGNVIKTALKDVLSVEDEIYSFSAAIKKRARTIQTSLIDNQTTLSKIYPRASNGIIRLMQFQDLNTFDIIFMSNLKNFTDKVCVIYERSLKKNQNVDKNSLKMIWEQLKKLERVFVDSIFKRSISDALWKDLSRELKRIEYMEFFTGNCNRDISEEPYKKIFSVLRNTAKPFNSNQEGLLKCYIREIEKNNKCSVLKKDFEAVNIVTSHGFVKGRWFKCLQSNHYYGYSASRQTNRCPQCKHDA